MKTVLLFLFVLIITLCNYGCSDSPTESIANNPCDTCVVAYKPNIYIYPTDTINLTLQITFPNGGKVLESIPFYNGAWNVTVAPDGKIDDKYDFLFYECSFPDLTQKEFGWLVNRNNLKEFFINNLKQSGFNDSEINDFTEYWIPKLNEFSFYEIYPQYKSTLDKLIDINFSKDTDNFYRLFYVIIGRNNNQIKLLAPIIETAKRKNYFAVEWGVIL